MREFRFRVPDTRDARRALRQAQRRTRDAGEWVRERVDDIDPPRIPLLDARRLVEDTRELVDETMQGLQEQHDATALAMQRLGEAELDAYDGPLRLFVKTFERLKNVDLSDIVLEEAPTAVRDWKVDIRDVDFKSVDALKTMAASGAAGASAGLTALGAVGTLATASTGTAIGTLSGAAATNATLAWLGGGAVAAGGGGMAAGAVVLGGIVALPVLAVGGLVVQRKGRRALAEAQSDAEKAAVAIEEMAVAAAAAQAIEERAIQLEVLVDRLADHASRRAAILEYLVDKNDDYATYDEVDRTAVMAAATTAKTLRMLLDVPVIQDDGTVYSGADEIIDASQALVSSSEHGS